VRQEVQILRVPVNRPIDAVPDVRTEGEVMIYPIVEEVVTVTRQLMLKEELRVSRVSRTEHRTEEVELRRMEAVVERTGPGS
jgi:stress response protein YsnF